MTPKHLVLSLSDNLRVMWHFVGLNLFRGVGGSLTGWLRVLKCVKAFDSVRYGASIVFQVPSHLFLEKFGRIRLIFSL